MTYDEAKELLKSISSKKRLLRAMQRRLDEELAQATSLKGFAYDVPKVKGGEGTPAQERYAVHIEKLQKDFDRVFSEMCAAEDMLSDGLSALSPVEQSIVVDRYMNGKSWRQIEREYGYTHDGAMSMHRRAVKKIMKK